MAKNKKESKTTKEIEVINNNKSNSISYISIHGNELKYSKYLLDMTTIEKQ